MSQVPIKQHTPGINPVAPLDLLRYALQGELRRPNRVFTPNALFREKASGSSLAEMAGACVPPRRKSCAWVLRWGNRVRGLVAAGQRSGHRSWEITRLSLDETAESQLPALLEQASHTVASHGGERIFIRLQPDDPLVDAARQSGFFPCMHEVHYTIRAPDLRGGSASSSSGAQTAPRGVIPADEYQIFRLYNAATPSDIRQVAAVTFEQWKASRDRLRGRCSELVFEGHGNIRGWVQAVRQSSVGQLATMVHPDDESLLPIIVGVGLQLLTGAKILHSLVPEYQIELGAALRERGFHPVSEYATLVKSIAVGVREDATASARVA